MPTDDSSCIARRPRFSISSLGKPRRINASKSPSYSLDIRFRGIHTLSLRRMQACSAPLIVNVAKRIIASPYLPNHSGPSVHRICLDNVILEIKSEAWPTRQLEATTSNYLKLIRNNPPEIENLIIRKIFNILAIGNRSDQMDMKIVEPMRTH